MSAIASILFLQEALPDNSNWWIYGVGAAAAVVIGVVAIIGAGLIVYMIVRKKKQARQS